MKAWFYLKYFLAVVLAGSSLFFCERLMANDTAAMGTAANIQFVQNNKIVIHREDLEIGPLTELEVPIRVHYVMENQGTKSEDLQIAFPLPGCSFSEYVSARIYSRTSRSETCIKEPRMELKVDGQKITNGSWTTLLSVRGVPFNQSNESKRSKITTEQLLQMFELLPDMPGEETAKQEKIFEQRLAALCKGLGEKIGKRFDCPAFRKIQSQRVFLWRNTFPAGKMTTVEHHYVVESSYNQYAEEAFKRDAFCLNDKSILKAWEKAQEYTLGETSALARQHFIGYILKTGANWAAPIGEFNLTLKKANANQYISTCFDGLKKTGSLEFRARRKNFLPKEDLFVLFFNMNVATPKSAPK